MSLFIYLSLKVLYSVDMANSSQQIASFIQLPI